MPHCGNMSRDEVVRALASRLAKRYNLPGGDALADAVLAREQEGSPVLMGGLAVPHARAEGLDRPYAALATRYNVGGGEARAEAGRARQQGG